MRGLAMAVRGPSGLKTILKGWKEGLCWCHAHQQRHSLQTPKHEIQRWCRGERRRAFSSSSADRSSRTTCNSSSGSSKCSTNGKGDSSTARGEVHRLCEALREEGIAFSAGDPLVLRFAPSPTGALHVGGARTALLNYILLEEHRSHLPVSEASFEGNCGATHLLSDRAMGRPSKCLPGRLILRIEDTDEARNTADSEAGLIEDLRWLGIKWDEGPDIGGPNGPYRQSERLLIYWQLGRELLQQDILYRCFCSKERLLHLRQERSQDGLPPRYDGRCRSLDPAEASRLAAKGKPFALRFRQAQAIWMPSDLKTISFNDALKGCVTFSVEQSLHDFVCFRPTKHEQHGRKAKGKLQLEAPISKSTAIPNEKAEELMPLGVPVYNFCAAVDDWLMGVTAVVRGEEHIPNTAAQILIAQALNAPIPRFCHLPVILAKEGGKISKRSQDAHRGVGGAPALSEQQHPSTIDAVRKAASDCEAASATTATNNSCFADYTIRGLRMRGFHPEAVIACLKGHHVGTSVQAPGNMMSCLSMLGRSPFCFDEQHLRHAHRRKIMQLTEDQDAGPLVEFFCDVLSKSPMVCDGRPCSNQDATPRSHTPKAPPFAKRENSAAALRQKDPWLLAFLSLAARLLLPQHTAPAAVASELVEVLRGRRHPSGEAIKRLIRSEASYEGQQFRQVAVALIDSQDSLAAFSVPCCVEESNNQPKHADLEKHEQMDQERLRLTRVGPAAFDAWIEALSKRLNAKKAKVMEFIRIALTGREVGPPLGKLLQLLQMAQLAGLPTCTLEGTGCLDAQELSRLGASSHHGCLDWLRRQCVLPVRARLSYLKSAMKL
ncbi:hypothetical protein Efla_005429 [Eimeria flavescens]